MRRPFIAGNWKMFTTPAAAIDLVRALAKALPGDLPCDVGLAPPFVCLPAAHEAIEKTGKNFKLGGQNVHWEKSGAFTGEVSAEMLRAAGCDFAIVGHSERRQYFGETDETVNRRLRATLAGGLSAIVCVGERLDQREDGVTDRVVTDQLTIALKDLTAADMARVTVAYEPVWAIGTGRNATPGQVQEVHALIRGLLRTRFGDGVALAARIQYGGSVKAANVDELMACPDVDGALVGGASLKVEEFSRIVCFKSGKA
jgi:triosephosphate isomerase (TIM)